MEANEVEGDLESADDKDEDEEDMGVSESGGGVGDPEDAKERESTGKPFTDVKSRTA